MAVSWISDTALNLRSYFSIRLRKAFVTSSTPIFLFCISFRSCVAGIQYISSIFFSFELRYPSCQYPSGVYYALKLSCHGKGGIYGQKQAIFFRTSRAGHGSTSQLHYTFCMLECQLPFEAFFPFSIGLPVNKHRHETTCGGKTNGKFVKVRYTTDINGKALKAAARYAMMM